MKKTSSSLLFSWFSLLGGRHRVISVPFSWESQPSRILPYQEDKTINTMAFLATVLSVCLCLGIHSNLSAQQVTVLDSYMFLLDAGITERPYIKVLLGPPQPDYIGRVREMPDGSIELLLDEEYYQQFEGKAQVQQLVYHLLGLQYRMQTRRGFMRPGFDYSGVSYRRLLKTFEYERRELKRSRIR